MDEHGRPLLEERAPMVLRRVPPERLHLARAMAAPAAGATAGRWWEWVDAADDAHLPAAAVAMTGDESGAGVVVSALGVHEDAEGASEALLMALLATLRSHGLDTVEMRSTERGVVRALLAAGFGPDPDVADRYQIAL
jgi:hypothetical protein